MPSDYSPSVAQLFTLGEPEPVDPPWMDYPATLGLTAADVPELIRAGTAPDFSSEEDVEAIWAAVHAWRALAQLGAVEAAGPLADLIGPDVDDWPSGELPAVFEVLGPDVVPALAAVVLDPARDPEAIKPIVVALSRIAATYPESRDACAAALEARLRLHPEIALELNTVLVGSLLDLKAAESAATLEAVYASGRLHTWVTGDWEDARVDLGLLPERLTPRPRNPVVDEIAAIERRWIAAGVGRGAWDDAPRTSTPSRKDRDRDRARKKMAKKSRKQNRRK